MRSVGELMEEEKKRAEALPFQMEPLFCAENQKMMIHNAVLLDSNDTSMTPENTHAWVYKRFIVRRTSNLDLEGNIYACCMNTLQKVGNLLK